MELISPAAKIAACHSGIGVKLIRLTLESSVLRAGEERNGRRTDGGGGEDSLSFLSLNDLGKGHFAFSRLPIAASVCVCTLPFQRILCLFCLCDRRQRIHLFDRDPLCLQMSDEATGGECTEEGSLPVGRDP